MIILDPREKKRLRETAASVYVACRACMRNSLFSRDSQLLFEPRATGLSPRPARHEEGVRRAVNYSPAAPTCSASPRMLPRGSPPASQERDDVAREIMLLPLVGHGLAPPRPPADVQWRACFGSTSRTIRPSCRPGGLPTATSTILGAAERLLCESCAAELARARPRVHARAATVHAHAADVLPLLC